MAGVAGSTALGRTGDPEEFETSIAILARAPPTRARQRRAASEQALRRRIQLLQGGDITRPLMTSVSEMITRGDRHLLPEPGSRPSVVRIPRLRKDARAASSRSCGTVHTSRPGPVQPRPGDILVLVGDHEAPTRPSKPRSCDRAPRAPSSRAPTRRSSRRAPSRPRVEARAGTAVGRSVIIPRFQLGLGEGG